MDRPVAKLRLLGSFGLTVDGIPRSLATRKAESLLAYLVLARTKPVSREKVLCILWPDVEEGQARRMLSTTLWRARKALSGAGTPIDSNGGSLSIDSLNLEVDVLRFKQLAESASTNPETRLADIERALALYAGDLLEGVDEEWCELERSHFRMTYLSLLKDSVTAHRERGAYQKAIQMARRVLELEPMDEDIHRELMLLFHLDGNRAAAIAQYQILRNTLQAELGIAPEDRTIDLWRYIRSKSYEIPGAPSPGLGGPWDTVEHAARNPIVGRDQELSRVLQGLTDALHGRGSLFIVSGQAGIGKTRLVEAVEVEAKLRGLEVLKGRCVDLRDPPPYQAFIEAVWPRISRKMQTDTPHILHDLLARLSPAIRRGRVLPTSAEAETAVVNETLLSLVDDESPVILILEDFQKGDRATKGLIHVLASRLGTRRIVVVLSMRTPLSRREFGSGLSTLRSAVEIRLGPLLHSQTDELIRINLRSRSVASSALTSIWERTAGNPFAVVEYLRFLTERGHLIRVGHSYWTWADTPSMFPQVPRRVQGLLRERVDALRGEARGVLLVAAVLGYEADLHFLEKLSGLEPTRFTEMVNQLLEHGLFVETARGYRFAHESYRLTALSVLTGPSRQLLHRKAAELMEELWPARSEDLSWHFLEAGDHAKATTYAEVSGDKARAVHANENALKWYTKALELLPSSSQDEHGKERRASLLLKRQEVLELLGDSRRQLGDLDEIIEHANLREDLELLARAQSLKAHALSRMNENVEALRAATSARRLYASMKDIHGQARAYEVSALIYMNLRDARRVRDDYKRALMLFQSAGDNQGAARAVLGLGTLMLFTGQSGQGLAYLERAEAILARSGNRRDYARALLQKGVFCRYLGQAAKSERLLARGIELMREHGDRVGEARGLSQLAYTHVTLGLLRKAFHEARRSIQLAIETGDTRGQIVFRNNAAYAVYRRLGDFGRAERCTREAISLVRTTGRRENQAIYYDTMAAILYDKGEYDAAHYWATESRRLYKRWSGQFDYVGAEIEFHLGATALALGKVDEARDALSQAVTHWQRSHDRALLSRGIALLGLAALTEGKLDEAVASADRSARLLRQCKGVEEIQHTYWVHAAIYKAAGFDRLSLRALERAYSSVLSHSVLLKGRLRKAFLAIPSNRRIVMEYDSARSGTGKPEALGEASMVRDPNLMKALTTEAHDVMARRERLLRLIRKGDARRRVLAGLLGVSERTIRNDIAALRNQGMLPRNLIPTRST